MTRRHLSILLCTAVLALPSYAAGQQGQQPPATGAAPASDQRTTESETQRGPVTAVIRVEPAEPTIGDTLTVTLEVTADKNVELLMPEFGQALERFPIVDFFPDQRVDDSGRTIASQRYSLEATMSGKASIPPLIIEFVDHRDGSKPAPEGEDAYELLTERLSFEIASVVPTEAATDLRPPLPELEPLRSRRFYGTLIAIVVGVLAVAALLLRRFRGTWSRAARQRSAYEVAIERLNALVERPLPGPDAVGTFFVELSDLIRHYLEDRFDLRAPELTTEEFLTVAAASPDLSAEHKGFLRDFLQSADMVKFARFVPGEEQVGEALDRARHFLEQTRGEEDEGAKPNA